MKSALLIRHSDRSEISNGREGLDVLLNDKGRLRARQLGKALCARWQRIRTLSSPVRRCIQTCECLREAFECAESVRTSDVLGMPGPFVFGNTDDSFGLLGTVETVKRLLKGVPICNVRSELEGTKILLEFLRREIQCCTDDTVCVFVSHDAVVVPVIHYFLGEMFDENDWLDFLDGLEFQFGSRGMRVTRFECQNALEG